MTLLKICGVRTIEDYRHVLAHEPDFIGFIFAESRRMVTPENVSAWIQQKNHTKHVGVFVNPSIEEIKETKKMVNLDVIQLHGNESKAFIKRLRSVIQVDVWKALPHMDTTIDKMKHFASVVDGFVIDTKVKGKWGGTGVRFDWASIPKYDDFSKSHRKICMIAGGITPTNVKECLSYAPTGIDLSSGLESAYKKDPLKLNELLERMNRYEHRNSR